MKISLEITMTAVFVLIGRIQIAIFLWSALFIGVQTLGVETLGVPQVGLVILALASILVPVFATEAVIKSFYVVQGLATLALLGWLAM